MASAAAEAPGSQADPSSICSRLQDLPQHVLAAIAALLSQRDRAALSSCSRELLAASLNLWWERIEASLGSQAAADSLSAWLRRRPAVETLHLHLAARDPHSRLAIEVQLPAEPTRE